MEIGLIISALGLGFASGFHCIGMCGPIALSLGLTGRRALGFYLQNLSYQLGRITTYALLGAVFGILGEGLSIVGLQQYLSLFAGVALILMAIFSFGSADFSARIPLLHRLLLRLKINLGKMMQRSGYSSRYLTGVLNGLLPCGMVYMALTASLAYGGLKEGAVFMALFGLGTLPFMFVIVLLGNLMTQALRIKILKLIPSLMLIMGALFILRGLQLGIPYLSPKSEALHIHQPNASPHTQPTCH